MYIFLFIVLVVSVSIVLGMLQGSSEEAVQKEITGTLGYILLTCVVAFLAVLWATSFL